MKLLWISLAFLTTVFAQEPKKTEQPANPEIGKIDARLAELTVIWRQETAIINRLTNNKKTPVQEGSQAYQQCLAASQRISQAESEAKSLKTQKASIEQGGSPTGDAATGDANLKDLPEAIAIAATGGQFEVGLAYEFTGPVLQMTEEYLLVQNLATKQPLGLLVFGDPKKVNNVAVDAGTMIQAKIRFLKFKNVTMADQTTKRLAVFDCLGFMPAGQTKLIDTSASEKNAKE
jgi:hypothetical protein